MPGDVKRWIRGTYIGRVGDELAEEDLLVGEGVVDGGEQLVDLGLEGEGLRLRLLVSGCKDKFLIRLLFTSAH